MLNLGFSIIFTITYVMTRHHYICIYFVYFVGGLRCPLEYFTYMTMASIMAGENRAVPKGKSGHAQVAIGPSHHHKLDLTYKFRNKV